MQKLQVLSSAERKGVSAKSGKAWEMVVCQCVLVGGDGVPVVGEVILPKGHPEVKNGAFYTPVTALGKGMNGKIEGQIVALEPVQVGVQPVSAARS